MNHEEASKGAARSGLLIAIAVATFGLSYGLNVVLARYLPPDLYGNLVFALRVLGAVAALSLLGTGTSSTRFLARYCRERSEENIESFLRWNTRLVRWPLLLSTGVGVSVCLAMFCGELLEIKELQSYHLATFMLWIAPLFAIVWLLTSYLLCTDHPVFSAASSQPVLLLVQLVVFFVVLAMLGWSPSLVLITGGLAVSALVAVALQLVFLRRRTPLRLLDLLPRRGAKPVVTDPEWLSVSMWLIGGQVVMQIGLLVDVSLLEAAPGREAEVGYYGAALTVTYLLYLLPKATLSPLAGEVSSLLASPATHSKLEAEIRRIVAVNLGLVLGLGLPMVWFSSDLLATFGPGFETAQSVVAISVANALVSSLGAPSITVMARSDMERRLLALSVAELVVMLVAGGLLVGPYGMVGVAIALLVAAVARAAVAVISIRRRYGIRPAVIL